MDPANRPRPIYPYTEKNGKSFVTFGIIIAFISPGFIVFSVLGILGRLMFSGVNLAGLAWMGLVIGLMAWVAFGPFSLIGLVFGIWMISEGRKAFRYSRQLDAEGVSVESIILDRWVKYTRPRRYGIAYRFETRPIDGSQIITQAEHNPAAYERYEVGDQVPVRYLPGSPDTCRLEVLE